MDKIFSSAYLIAIKTKFKIDIFTKDVEHLELISSIPKKFVTTEDIQHILRLVKNGEVTDSVKYFSEIDALDEVLLILRDAELPEYEGTYYIPITSNPDKSELEIIKEVLNFSEFFYSKGYLEAISGFYDIKIEIPEKCASALIIYSVEQDKHLITYEQKNRNPESSI